MIADLHCDLLAYLAEGGDLLHPEARCSLPQLQKGGVSFQVLAIFVQTGKGSVEKAKRQYACYQTLLSHPAFVKWDGEFPQEKIAICLAIENASALCEEKESLERCFERLPPAPLYVSLTWNGENRFGGGNHTKVGLKRDGELLLDYLSGKGIAIDLSHTSDHLAYDILEYLDKKKLQITPIASHSNLRAVHNQPRNLPDELAREVIKRGGVIGFNLVRRFIGEKPPAGFLKHIEHMRALDGMEHLCFGADFFFDGTVSPVLQHLVPFYYKGFEEASCYPALLDLFQIEEREKVAYRNLQAFFEREKKCT